MDSDGIGWDRQPPYAPEAEVAVLAAMLISPDAIAEARASISVGDFYREAHRRIFRAIVALDDRGSAVDTVTLVEQLKSTDELEASGGIPYVAEMLDVVPTAEHVGDHAAIVREKAKLRRLIEASSTIIRDVYEGNGRPAAEILEGAEEKILDVFRAGEAGGFVRLKDRLWSVFEEIEAEGKAGGGTVGIPSGIGWLDRMTGGFLAGDLTVIAGRPSQGKTALMQSFLAHAAIENHVGAIVSYEMSARKLIRRDLAREGLVDMKRARTKDGFSTDEYQRLAAAAGHLNTREIWIDENPRGTLADVRMKVRRLVAAERLEIVAIDYLQLMDAEAENRTQEVSKLSRGLKRLAQDLDIHVVALSQLSRAVESRTPPRPRLSDLKESGSIEQDADTVLFIWRPETYFDEKTKEAEREKFRNKAELIVGKQRDGDIGRTRLYYQKEYLRFSELTEERS